jgi:hypothetical protein
MMARIKAAPHPGMSMASTDHFGAEIRIHLRDGRVLLQTTDRPLGRGPDKPLPLPLLEAKFTDCAGRVMDAGSAALVMETIWRLDELDDMGVLRQALAGGCRMRRQAAA